MGRRAITDLRSDARLLLRELPAGARELTDSTPLSRSAVYRHLKTLANKGIVTPSSDGTWRLDIPLRDVDLEDVYPSTNLEAALWKASRLVAKWHRDGYLAGADVREVQLTIARAANSIGRPR